MTNQQTHELRLEHDENALLTGIGFRAACSCGWVSIWRTTNACMGNGHRHVSASKRAKRGAR